MTLGSIRRNRSRSQGKGVVGKNLYGTAARNLQKGSKELGPMKEGGGGAIWMTGNHLQASKTE